MVSRDDRDELRWLAQQLRGRQVNRVQGADRFNRKRPAGTGQHASGHRYHRTPALECLQGPESRAFFHLRNPAGRTGADQAPGGFRKCECRGDANAPRPQLPENVGILFEERQTLRVTPAMEAGVTDQVWSVEEIVRIID